MLKRTLSRIMLTLLLIGMLTLTFNIQRVKAGGTIYIRADGSVEPDTAPISTADNVTYIFTDNIYDSIVVERDNIVVDGTDHTVQGTDVYPSKGIDLSGRGNITIKNIEIDAFYSRARARSLSLACACIRGLSSDEAFSLLEFQREAVFSVFHVFSEFCATVA